jgi:hypothetical protein
MKTGLQDFEENTADMLGTRKNSYCYGCILLLLLEYGDPFMGLSVRLQMSVLFSHLPPPPKKKNLNRNQLFKVCYINSLLVVLSRSFHPTPQSRQYHVCKGKHTPTVVLNTWFDND